MSSTVITASFVAPDVIQLRLELGAVLPATLQPVVPDGLTGDPDHGWVWQDGGWIGRVIGDSFMPVDGYAPSVIDDLFDRPTADAATAPADDPARWSVTVNGRAVDLAGLSRKAMILDTAEVQWGAYRFSTAQSVFLALDAPLATGVRLTIGFDDPDFAPVTVTYDPARVVSEAIHVNLTGFDPDDPLKVAYLSSWNGWAADPSAPGGGMAVGQVYDGPLDWAVIDLGTGATVLTGQTSLVAPATQPTTTSGQNFAGTDVWAMDLSALSTPGRYAVVVEGVGRSQAFTVSDDHWGDLFQTSFSGFYHQRSGIALEAPFTDWLRGRALHPDDGRVTVYATTTRLMDTDEGYDNSLPDQFAPLVASATSEVLPDAWGGWHDAGDWDRRTQHMEAARALIDLVEMQPDWARATDGRLPESGDRIPDLLDEALWGLSVFARLQTADGSVRGGIEAASYRGYGAASFDEELTLFAYAPDTWSSWEFAASAAKAARALAPYDPGLSAEWLERAERAMDWAEARVPTGAEYDATLQTLRNLAALELYAATGQSVWHDLYLATSNYAAPDTPVEWYERQFEAARLYSRLDPALTRDDVAARSFAAVAAQAQFLLDQGRGSGFGAIMDPYAPYGWGLTAQQPLNAAEFMVFMHHMTGDDAWLTAILSDVQYGLGANPQNMVYMTGLDGLRGPELILNADADAMGGRPPPGITIYGDYSIFDYGRAWFHDVMANDAWPDPYVTPIHESHQGFWGFVPSTEYTVQQGITDMTVVTGYLAALRFLGDGAGWAAAPGAPPPAPVTGAVQRIGGAADDTIAGGAARDRIDGQAGNDRLAGGAGQDLLRGRWGDDTLLGQAGADQVIGGGGADLATGGDGSDWIEGGDGNDTIFGGAGHDTLLGGAGNDRAVGGTARDRIEGGTGDDTLTGGAQADLFIFRAGDGADQITDFQPGVDRIGLDAALWGGGLGAAGVIARFGQWASTGSGLTLEFGAGDRLTVLTAGDLLPADLVDALILA